MSRVHRKGEKRRGERKREYSRKYIYIMGPL